MYAREVSRNVDRRVLSQSPIQADDLNALNVIHITGTKGKVGLAEVLSLHL